MAKHKGKTPPPRKTPKKVHPPQQKKNKYPDTDTFHNYNANPKGKQTSDALFRAICTALSLPYEQVVRELAELQIETGIAATDITCYNKYLEMYGYTQRWQPKREDKSKYNGNQFCTLMAEPDKTYVVRLGSHHIVAVVNSKIYDTWNSTYEIVGTYWVKKDD